MMMAAMSRQLPDFPMATFCHPRSLPDECRFSFKYFRINAGLAISSHHVRHANGRRFHLTLFQKPVLRATRKKKRICENTGFQVATYCPPIRVPFSSFGAENGICPTSSMELPDTLIFILAVLRLTWQNGLCLDSIRQRGQAQLPPNVNISLQSCHFASRCMVPMSTSAIGTGALVPRTVR